MGVRPEDQALAAAALVEGLQPDAPIGFAVHDRQLRFALVSPSLAAIDGRPPAEHLGRRAADFLPPEAAAFVDARLAEVLESSSPRTGVEVSGVSPDRPGEERGWVAGFYPVALGERRLVGAVLVDITERRRAEAALRESEAELSGAQRMAGVGWWTWTAEPETVVYAPELLDLMGRDPALGGTPQSRDQLVMVEGELESVRETAMAALAGGRPFARRLRALHADGRTRLLEARADVVHDADGRPVGLEGFLQDITELARAEQRQRAVAELGQQALEEHDLDALLQHAVDAVGREIGVDGVGVLEVLPGGGRALIRALSRRLLVDEARTIPIEPGGVIDRTLATGSPVVTPDLLTGAERRISSLERDAGARSVVTAVIGGRAAPFGVIGAMSAHPDHFSEEDAAFMTAIANVLADTIERRAVQEEVARISAARGRLVAQAIDAEDRARRSISDALHDGALQELLAVRNELFAMAGRGGDDAALGATRDRLTAIVGRLRDVMSALHPSLLHYGGLEAALLAVAEQERGAAGFEARVSVEPQASGARDDLVLSLARELLANAARHAGAGHVDVAVRSEPDAIVLSVADDGAGIAPGRLEAAPAEGAIGIASCRERVEALGGALLVRTAPGAGTEAVARIPHVAEPSAAEVGRSSLQDDLDGA